MAFTYFFRDKQTLDYVQKYAIPEFRKKRHINVWDAGCAMGQEPYSLAIIFRENMGHFLFRNLKIYATDIDSSNRFEEIINTGIYSEDQIKRIPPEIKEKYFSRNGKENYFKISEEIKESVYYQKHDLLSLKIFKDDFSLIVCKNVLLHFSEAERVEVIRMFNKCLAPGGFFVTEQTQKMPPKLNGLFQQVTSNVQLYRKAE